MIRNLNIGCEKSPVNILANSGRKGVGKKKAKFKKISDFGQNIYFCENYEGYKETAVDRSRIIHLADTTPRSQAKVRLLRVLILLFPTYGKVWWQGCKFFLIKEQERTSLGNNRSCVPKEGVGVLSHSEQIWRDVLKLSKTQEFLENVPRNTCIPELA